MVCSYSRNCWIEQSFTIHDSHLHIHLRVSRGGRWIQCIEGEPFSSHIFAHSPISFRVEDGRMVTISMRYATVLSMHVAVLERREREWKREEWFRVVICLPLNELND